MGILSYVQHIHITSNKTSIATQQVIYKNVKYKREKFNL